jgi:hypothetical protein
VQTPDLARQDYGNAIAEARMLKESFRNIMGGWKVDEYGNETYQEGCQF